MSPALHSIQAPPDFAGVIADMAATEYGYNSKIWSEISAEVDPAQPTTPSDPGGGGGGGGGTVSGSGISQNVAYAGPPKRVKPVPVGSGIYRYVSNGGSGSGTGASASSPISLDRAGDVVRGGDVLILLDDMDLNNMFWRDVSGAQNAPIRITGGDADGNVVKRTLRCNSSGRSSAILGFYGCNWIHIHNLLLDCNNGRCNDGIFLGEQAATDGAWKACTNFLLHRVDVRNSRQPSIKISGQSHDVTLDGCDVDGAGYGLPSSEPYAECVYLGEGNNDRRGVWNIFIYRCVFRNNNATAGGEGVDCKRDSYNITIKWCLFLNLTMHSQGAVTVLINTRGYPQPSNVLIQYNVFYNIRRKSGGVNGDAVSIGRGGVTVDSNIIFDTQEAGVQVYSWVSASPTSDVTITNNTFARTGGATIIGHGSATMNVSGNLSDDGAFSQTSVVASDFIASISGQADAGLGVGSAFQLRADSPKSGGPDWSQ